MKFPERKKILLTTVFVLALLGLFDSIYLTYEHFVNIIPPCSTNIFFLDCGKVLNSKWSAIGPIPVALLGVINYSFLIALMSAILFLQRRLYRYLAIIQVLIAFLVSLYFLYLQIFVIRAFCIYCLASALISALLFILIQFVFSKERKLLAIHITSVLYKNIIKRILFLIDPEKIHTVITSLAELFSKIPFFTIVVSYLFDKRFPLLEQNILGLKFKTPIGLAAGFDYEAKLTNVLYPLSLGFQAIGTITNKPYQGNTPPRLGRLPKSRSLMVNKGFKNHGVSFYVNKLKGEKFRNIVGISVGRTNNEDMNLKESILDILSSFKNLERANLKNSYYELNISCPNLHGKISFYPPKNLGQLLAAIDQIKLSKPLFIKMPIILGKRQTLALLKIISKHTPAGVIIGNLSSDRKNPLLEKAELKNFPVGNFSGKPTYALSNEYISLAYNHFGKRFIIIGCGGVFNGHDAFEKISRGASLVQIVTALVFEGPQVVAQINNELEEILDIKGFSQISQAIGSAHS